MLVTGKLFAALIAAAAAGVLGSPIELEKRENGFVGYCPYAVAGGGTCYRVIWPLGECHSLANDPDDNSISSFNPYGLTCTLWDGYDCEWTGGDSYTLPGPIDDLSTVGFNDKTSSYKCV